MKINIHNYEKRYAGMIAGLERSRIRKQDKKTILEHDRYLAAKGIGLARRLKYLEILRILSGRLKRPLAITTRDDLLHFFSDLDTRPYTEWTRNTYRMVVKTFWKWLKGEQNDNQFPEEVSWIKFKRPKKDIPAEQMLNEGDIHKLLECARALRDRAMIAVLWETGMRVTELGTLSVEDVHFDKHGALLSVDGKTGPRRVRIIQSVPALANWLNQHPNKESLKAPLWVTNSNNGRGKRLQYPIIRKMLREIGRIAGIKKRINPHAFRHARATFLAPHITEALMCRYLGWTQGSRMPQVYVHLSGRDTDDAMLRLNGIEPQNHKPEESLLKPCVCSRCGTINASENSFCRHCGSVIALNAAMEMEDRTKEAEETLHEVLKDEAVKRAVQEALIKLKVSPLPKGA